MLGESVTNSGSADGWSEFWDAFDRLQLDLRRSKAINVNASRLRSAARELVQLYFRRVRPELQSAGLEENDLAGLDQPMQELLRLSHGRNVKQTYIKILKEAGKCRVSLFLVREQGLHKPGQASNQMQDLTLIEQRIFDTLQSMLPLAAASYKQACRDLCSPDRVSFRGTAVELREALRELLDQLAPDKAVTKEPGFALEASRKGPTMRQKARFVLRHREYPDTALKAPLDAIALIDEHTAALVRSVYELGSASTHGGGEHPQVRQLKMYVDTVMAELLQVHRN